MAYRKTMSAARGQKIIVDSGRDDSSFNKGNGKQNMGGSTTNLAHSLSGASAKVDSDNGKKNKF